MLVQIVDTYTKRFNVHAPYFKEAPRKDTCLIICIPAFKEPEILTTLRSLAKGTPPTGAVELIIVVNAPQNATTEILEINSNTVSQINDWIENEQPNFIHTFLIREESILKKDAGAGMARKIGMDEAVQRWAMLNMDGPIICLDADCTVSKNYLVEAEKVFQAPATKVGHFQFEHEYEKEINPVLRQGIIQYELHLRCYIEGLRQAGYPNAIHTVGSCMAVRASSYAKSGGMNKRKAGEDFYFLHKLVPLGGFKNIPATVYPSCRVSDRVPFGTGRAQMEWIGNKEEALTYSAAIYSEMNSFFKSIHHWYDHDVALENFSDPIKHFLSEHKITERVNEIRKQSSSIEIFTKRFWQWMDGFMVLKLTHYMRDHGFPSKPSNEVSRLLLDQQNIQPSENLESLLIQFRLLDFDTISRG